MTISTPTQTKYFRRSGWDCSPRLEALPGDDDDNNNDDDDDKNDNDDDDDYVSRVAGPLLVTEIYEQLGTYWMLGSVTSLMVNS